MIVEGVLKVYTCCVVLSCPGSHSFRVQYVLWDQVPPRGALFSHKKCRPRLLNFHDVYICLNCVYTPVLIVAHAYNRGGSREGVEGVATP